MKEKNMTFRYRQLLDRLFNSLVEFGKGHVERMEDNAVPKRLLKKEDCTPKEGKEDLG
jgi:hypothetical protein